MAQPLAHQVTLLRTPSRTRVEDDQVHPLLSIGFRPFFFLASLMAAVWIPLWLHVLSGGRLATRFPSITWHAHEMLFGFTSAVIAGFLLTAASNWTGRRTASGAGLLGLSLLWLLARVLLLLPAAPSWLLALVDLAFFPALAVVLGRAMVASDNVRNYPFLGMLGLLFVANALMHAEVALADSPVAFVRPGLGATIALRAITLMMIVMGGRVIPMFTRNATQAPGVESRPSVDKWAIGSFVAAAILATIFPRAWFVGFAWLVAGGLHLYRMKTWGTRHASAPLLWILHAGYASIALSLILESLAVFGWVLPSAATHLLTVGGIGGLCLGMMTRVSLGHSGRMLVAPRRMTLSFAFLAAAACVRVAGPVFVPELTMASYLVSGLLWTTAFFLLLTFGLSIWFSPRADQTREVRK